MLPRIALLLVAVVALGVPASSQDAPASPTDSDWEWLDEHQEAAFDELMPLTPSPRPVAAYRSYRDLYEGVVEKYFTIDFVPGPHGGLLPALSATTVVPVGASVQRQFLNAHMADRAAPVEAVLATVQVRRTVVDESDCPAIRARVEGIPALVLSPTFRNVIYIHPDVHRIIVRLDSVVVDATVTAYDHPLARWAVGTYEALQACLPD
jgi:hypothetical protein